MTVCIFVISSYGDFKIRQNSSNIRFSPAPFFRHFSPSKNSIKHFLGTKGSNIVNNSSRQQACSTSTVLVLYKPQLSTYINHT